MNPLGRTVLISRHSSTRLSLDVFFVGVSVPQQVAETMKPLDSDERAGNVARGARRFDAAMVAVALGFFVR
jgi:hypothetical protein